jgi:hypothetical protein
MEESFHIHNPRMKFLYAAIDQKRDHVKIERTARDFHLCDAENVNVGTLLNNTSLPYNQCIESDPKQMNYPHNFRRQTIDNTAGNSSSQFDRRQCRRRLYQHVSTIRKGRGY